MTDLTIRKANKSEYTKVTDVFLKSFIPDGVDQSRRERIIQHIKSVMELNLTEFTFLELDEETVGLGGETRFIGSAFIGYIGVIPKYRKKGYGSKVFDVVLKEAKKYNKTIELFSNPGADSIYRRFGFREEYLTNIYSLTSSSNDLPTDEIEVFDTIPKWIFNLDREALKFDRSKLLAFLQSQLKAEVVGIGTDGFAFCRDSNIGPVIAKNATSFQKLIKYLASKEEMRIVLPEFKEKTLEMFSPTKIQTCIKMYFGEKLKQKLDWIYGFNAFATS
ncbi:MAG: GNAT family N-acetyltransferase [Asgard group archaeon]|nr:GNAT family N-acetyltransferase [Asgard group archaeon]